MSENASEFKKSLGLLDATMLVAGSMIGSGIFIVSSDIARNTGSVGWLMVVWLIAGFMTLTAALSYGELSAMFPRAGGQYVYLKEAYKSFSEFHLRMDIFCRNSYSDHSCGRCGLLEIYGISLSYFG